MPRTGLKPTVVGLFVVLCFMPVLVGRGSYRPAWDDSYFLRHTVCVNRAVANHDLRAVGVCLGTLDKGPLMALVGIPWGRRMNSVAGLGLAFFSLCLLEWLLVAALIALLLALRVPYLLIGAVAVTLPLSPFLRGFAGSYYADMPLALAVALACLLLPLEATQPSAGSWTASVGRGALWGATLAVGLLGKTTFLVFAAIIGPFLVIQRWRVCGRRAAVWSLASAALVASPAIVITIAYWGIYYRHSQMSAFGQLAHNWSHGLDSLGYLAEFVTSSKAFSVVVGLQLVGLAAALQQRRREAYAVLPGVAALAIYWGAVLSSPNQDTRFMMPILVGLPFALTGPWARLRGVKKVNVLAGVPLWLLAGLLVSVPMITRADMTHIVTMMHFLSDHPVTGGRVRVMLVSDSPMVNRCTLWLAKELLLPGKGSDVDIETVVYDEPMGRDLPYSLGRIAAADYVVMQADAKALAPEWTNRRFVEYRRATLTAGRLVPELSSALFEVYAVQKLPAPR